MNSRKPIIWVGSSKKDLLNLSIDVQRMMGYSLNLAQQGKDDSASTILKGFGSPMLEKFLKKMRGELIAQFSL